ncbi:MAG: UpxY family transcription antiterminator [Bacteroidia bacterium]|nr:UpxY family transcription antiterminator [Bacteroidia bacterium]MCF8447879.1 UpxY family transcription antiterminator [Bacteroidia bacterium]
MIEKKKESTPHWYLLYTNPRAEKKVEVELQVRGFEVFLPIHKTLRQWSDRKKWVEEPLFKSYLFIYTELEKNFYSILSVPGVVKFVNFEKKPAIVDAREIELVKLMLGNVSDLESLGYEGMADIEIGDAVKVMAGPLMGTEGKLVDRRGNKHLLIELVTMQQNLVVSIPFEYLQKIF